MSTLYNALRKAEERNDKEQHNGNSITPPRQNKNSIVLVLVLLFIFVGVVYIQIARMKKIEKARKAAAEKKKAAIMQPVALPPVKMRQPGEYVLEGVIYSDSPSVIINGKLLKVGGKIDNLTVKSIMPKSVDLIKDQDKSVVTLKM